jgi:hypothetical protein
MLTKQDFEVAANSIGCNLAVIQMFHEVESAGNGYLNEPGQSSRLKILFEGHQFWKQLVEAGADPYDALSKYPAMKNVLYKKWTREHYVGGAKEWTRMSKAIALCKDIGIKEIYALNSASYGAFQIMGFNAELAGYFDAQEMITEFNNGGEAEQLMGFVNYIKSINLDDDLILMSQVTDYAIIKKICAVIAKAYNGPGYKGNPATTNDDYDLKLFNAYLKFSK